MAQTGKPNILVIWGDASACGTSPATTAAGWEGGPRTSTASRISSELRKDRELSFYGIDDWIPTEEYSAADSSEAIRKAERVFEIVSPFIR